VSRNDLRKGYQVVVDSVDVHTTYSWELAFIPTSTGGGVDPLYGIQSAATFLAPEGSTSSSAKFDIDYEGSYLVRLTVDDGMPGEDTQYIRLRYLSVFGDIFLVAAGERRDSSGTIPVDVDPEGWANEQNANLQRILGLVRRNATSGRVLHVDANRGRDSTATPNDPDNLVDFPGHDLTDLVSTGFQVGAEGFGDFATIQDAIDYAADAVSRGEPALSYADPYVIYIQPGFYEEDLTLESHVHLIGLGPDPLMEVLTQDVIVAPDEAVGTVIVQTTNSGGGTSHSYAPGDGPDAEAVLLMNLVLQNTDSVVTTPVLSHTGGLLVARNMAVLQKGTGASQGPAYSCVTADTAFEPYFDGLRCTLRTLATDTGTWAAIVDAPNSRFSIRDGVIRGGGSALRMNESLYHDGGTINTFLNLDRVLVLGAAGYGYWGYTGTWFLERCRFSGSLGSWVMDAFGAGPASYGSSIAGGMFQSSFTTSPIIDSAPATGTFILQTDTLVTPAGAVVFSFPGGAPAIYTPGSQAYTLRYARAFADPVTLAPVVPPAQQLTVDTVQEAIDALILADVGGIGLLVTVDVDSGAGAGVRYVADANDGYIGVDTTTPTPGLVTIELPNTVAAGAVDGRQIIIKDQGGGIGTPGQEILIEVGPPPGPPQGEIDNVVRGTGTELTLSNNDQSVSLVCRGVSGGIAKWYLV